ncbi:retrovirus-related Pol polyprotein from transposon 412 [Trichonephila clavipes]|nr:retrovirus-related Pol polyprotein from transposon 412 [Trichonephila clavipes]
MLHAITQKKTHSEEDCSRIMWSAFERIAFDIPGQFLDHQMGNNSILGVMDYFTKWPEAYPISDQEATTVSEVLVQHWISRFGVPLQLT